MSCAGFEEPDKCRQTDEIGGGRQISMLRQACASVGVLRWDDADRIDGRGARAHQVRRMIDEVVEPLAVKSLSLGTKFQVCLNTQYDLPITAIDLPFVPAA